MEFKRMKFVVSIFLIMLGCASALAEGVSESRAKPPSDFLPGGKDYIPDAPIAHQLCHQARFHCRKVTRNDSWSGLFADDQMREEIMRLNRTNVAIQYRPFVILPKHKKQIDFKSWSPLPEHYKTDGKPLVYVDLNKFAFGAYDAEGKLVKWGPAAGGKAWCSDLNESCKTVTGEFHVQRMGGANCQSHTYPVVTHGGAPMPYCMFFYKGFAIHGSTLSGFANRSRGCVHLHPLLQSKDILLREYLKQLQHFDQNYHHAQLHVM
jgi:L,D-transpeptidase ErfK/SrfK